MQAIKSVSDRLSNDCEDVEMNTGNPDMMVDLWEKCSLQGNFLSDHYLGCSIILFIFRNIYIKINRKTKTNPGVL